MQNKISIIGFGRFGKVLADLLHDTCDIDVYDNQPDKNIHYVNYVDLATACKNDTIFIAVPIRQFESIIKQIAPLLNKSSAVIDTCSVKVFPVEVMQRELPENIDIIATHPMFGPDSYQANAPLKIMMHTTRNQHNHYQAWKNLFAQKNIDVIEITPDQHDKIAAYSQGVTHFVGRTLQAINAKPSNIDTLGYTKLLSVMEQTCNDSIELFEDLIQYNPYGKQAIEDFVEKAKLPSS